MSHTWKIAEESLFIYFKNKYDWKLSFRRWSLRMNVMASKIISNSCYCLFTEKRNSKAPHCWPICEGNPHRRRMVFLTNSNNAERVVTMSWRHQGSSPKETFASRSPSNQGACPQLMVCGFSEHRLTIYAQRSGINCCDWREIPQRRVIYWNRGMLRIKAVSWIRSETKNKDDNALTRTLPQRMLQK